MILAGACGAKNQTQSDCGGVEIVTPLSVILAY